MIWRAHIFGAAASVLAAVLWVGLAWRSPSSTHHFAPLVAAGAWGYLTRQSALPTPSVPDRLLMLGGGVVVAVSAQIVLTVSAKLNGPPLIEAISVPLELASMAVLGALIGSGAWCFITRPAAAAETG